MNWKNLIIAGVLGATLVGCSQEAKEDATQATDKAGQAISKGADQVKDATENAVMTGKIRSALLTANDVKIDELNVDTIGKKIILKGKAKDQKSKDTAGTIAKTQAGSEYTIENDITVG